jgi:hexokinase
MPPLQALFNDNPQSVFDDIDRHFQLGRDVLVDLAKAFLDEIKVGLESYNYPMAMVYVLHSYTRSNPNSSSVLHLLRVFRMVLKLGALLSLIPESYNFS